MKPLITVILLLLTFAGFAQKKQNVYFLKYDGRYVDNRDSADYVRVVQEPDSGSVLYKVFEYYLNGKTKTVGLSSKIDPPRYEGIKLSYYKNGNKQLIYNYKNDLQVGDQYEYYPNGKIYESEKFPESTTLLSNSFSDDYLITAEYDSLGTALIVNGNGYYKGYDRHFKTIVEEGTLLNGKKTGVWKGSDANLHLRYVEAYENGKLISGTSFSDAGDSVTYSKSRSTEPGYKGGIAAFYNYVGRNVEYPDYERAHDIQGKVILTFVVEKDGKTADIKILSSVSKSIDAEAVRVIKHSPAWIPAMMYGRKIRSYYTLPINFGLTN